MMNGGMSVILLHAIYCSIRGFAGISIAWCKVQLYPLHFMAKKKKKKKKKRRLVGLTGESESSVRIQMGCFPQEILTADLLHCLGELEELLLHFIYLFIIFCIIIIYFSVVIVEDNVFINCPVHSICVQITPL